MQGTFALKSIQFRYNRMLLCKQDLSRRGPRLQATKAQMLEPTYAIDASLSLVVTPPQPRLQVQVKRPLPTLFEGEVHTTVLVLQNTGSRTLQDLRVLCDNDFAIMSKPDLGVYRKSWSCTGADSRTEPSIVYGGHELEHNSLVSAVPTRISLPPDGLKPGQKTEWPVTVRGPSVGHHKLRWLFAFYTTVS